MIIHSPYLGKIFHLNDRRVMVESMVTATIESMLRREFDAIAFSGISGAGIAFALSDVLGIPLINVRKDDKSHFVSSASWSKNRYLEGAIDAKRYIIVDDLIETGSTVRRIVNLIEEHNSSAECTEVLLFDRPYDERYFVFYDAKNRRRKLTVHYGGLD